MPTAQGALKSMFSPRSAAGAIGGRYAAVPAGRRDFRDLARRIARCGVAMD